MTGVYKYFKLGRRSGLDQMSGVQFEFFLLKFFQHCGYNAEKTPVSNDFGADLIIEDYRGRCVIQAKRQRGTVGITAVQEVNLAKSFYQANKAMVITNSKFSNQAVKAANKSNIELWDGERLKNELSFYNYSYY
jgi:HJR/Mrr/RecB family endonuclease